MARDSIMSMEATPLLVERDKDSTPLSRYRFKVHRPRTIVFLLSLIILIESTGANLMVVPTTRILEDVICHRYYDVQELDNSIDERLCKTDAIQSKLAYLNGLVSVAEAIVGLTVAFPYGILADRVGRKPIFFIWQLGTILNISWQYIILFFWHAMPVRLIILAPIFSVIGGGYTVVVAVLYSIIADVESDSNRASAFLLMSFAFLFGNLLGPAMAARLMETGSPWTPLVIAYILIPLGSIIMIFVPETLKSKQDVDQDTSLEARTLVSTVKNQLKEALTHSTNYFLMLKSGSLVLILITYLIHFPVIIARGQFFAQYFSKRFDWKLSQTGYFLSLRGFISIFVLLVGLPGLSNLLLSPSYPFRWTASRKDLNLARLSVLSVTIGSMLFAGPNLPMVISGIIVMTLGDGLSALCRSLATSFVGCRHTSSLYVLIGISETLGMVYAGPTLAWFFEKGMKLKGLWLGMPYIWLASISALATVGLCFVRLPTDSAKSSEVDSIGDDVGDSSLVDGFEAEIWT